jgi:helicase required for RNAi-mediated heterochromatin assembly 1
MPSPLPSVRKSTDEEAVTELTVSSIPHSQVKCQSSCQRLLRCGHICSEVCFRPCKCRCSTTVSTIPTRNPPEKSLIPRVESFASQINGSEQHVALIQSYRNFANGGAEREDARLAAVTQQLTLEEEHRRLDEESFRCLFGTPSISPSTVEKTTVEPVSHVHGETRRRYIQYYSNQGGLASKEKISAPEPSLLDSLI